MKVIVQPVGLLLLASLSLLGCTAAAVAAVPSDQDSDGKLVLSSEGSSVAHVIHNNYLYIVMPHDQLQLTWAGS